MSHCPNVICNDTLTIIFSFMSRLERKDLSLVCRKYYNVNVLLYRIEENDKEKLKYVYPTITNKSIKICGFESQVVIETMIKRYNSAKSIEKIYRYPSIKNLILKRIVAINDRLCSLSYNGFLLHNLRYDFNIKNGEFIECNKIYNDTVVCKYFVFKYVNVDYSLKRLIDDYDVRLPEFRYHRSF